MQWQALLVYHPLWEAQTPTHFPQSAIPVEAKEVPPTLLLPALTIQPMQTVESERRRQRVLEATRQQQQALNARLQQMEARLLQEELAQIDAEQRVQMETARQELIRQAGQAVEETLRQYQPQQATAEIKRRVIQRLLRIRPDQRDALSARLKQAEADQQTLSAALERRLVQIEEETAERIRARVNANEEEYERKRTELRERSAKRLQAEQSRASLQIRAFANGKEPVRFASITLTLPRQTRNDGQSSPLPTSAREDLRALIEQDVRQWVEAICRRHRWLPVWQARAGLPDVTAQIAREMRGTIR